MNLDLDPELLRTSMTLWRDVVEHKVPVHDNIKVNLMSRQADNLKNFIKVGQSWKTVLGSCKPTSPQDEIEFEALMAEVNEFVSWAKEKLEAIAELGIQEAFIDKAQELLSDPDLGPSIRNLIKSIRKQAPEGGKGQGRAAS